MNLKKSQDRINELMSRFVTQVKAAGAMSRTDINHVSEDVLLPLFREIYGYTGLENLNKSEGPNFPAIDLGDKETGIAYQITSKVDSQKIKGTLKKFVDRKLYEQYNRLVIYCLTEKQKTYQGRGFDEIIPGKFTFDKKNDILDYQDLLKKISGFPLEKSRRVESILEQHFGDKDDESLDPLGWLEKTNNLWGGVSATIKINRDQLLNDLQDFASRGNGVIIGSPGVGKTYLLNELCQSLKSDGIPHLLLPIDELGDGTNDTLQQELSYKGDLIEQLKSVPVSEEKAILLFDAFDAARNEETRKRFLRLIRRAVSDLSESWNIILTVRTYDAEKSPELLDLFDPSDDTDQTQYRSKDIRCRHFKVLPLNEDEIRQTFGQILHLESIYNKPGSEEFKRLLVNPFNLWLLEQILRDPQEAPDFSQIHSVVQLLDEFWKRRIKTKRNEDDRRCVLKRIAYRMVMELSLNVSRDDVYEDLDSDKTAIQTAWHELLSDEILVKESSTGQRIAFSHDILFDYAISVLLIEDEPQKLENFVREDQARPIFLRPSLTYFLTRLWHKSPESFWNAFWHILPQQEPVHLRLFVRLIPTSVIANEARETDQLTQLLEQLQNGEDIANEAIMLLLKSIHTLQIERDPLWSNFFDQVSAHLHRNFAWDLASLTSDILKRATEDKNTTIIEVCGRIGRRLLEWVWQKREADKDDLYNRLGSFRAVPLVAKTYGTNVEKSRELLEKVLKLMQEANFPIGFLRWLIEDVDKIWHHDPEFVTLIYRVVFTYHEISDEKTNQGSGPIIPLISTRRQDYSCQHQLVKHFSNFLRATPLSATRTVIQILNFCIAQGHIVGYLKEGEGLEDLTETFKFRGKLSYFVQDNSYIWDERESRNEPVEMANALFEFIAELARSEESLPLLDSLLDVFRDNVYVAFFWKRLLKTAAQFPKVFAPRLFELCIAKPIQTCNEALYELRLFLETAMSEFTLEQRLQIEETILELPREATDENFHNVLLERRNRLLAQIPLHLLITDEAKQIRTEMERENDVPENQPLFSVSYYSEPYSEVKSLQREGVDTTKPENQEIQRFFGPLDEFSSNWRDGKATEETTAPVLPELQEAYKIIKRNTGADKKVIDSLRYKLTACAAILVQVADNHESQLFAFCREVLLDGATHELPKPDPQRDAQFNDPGYAPCPRHEAARGLPILTARHPDSKILDAIESLANDLVPSVRMVTAMELFRVYCKTPERFWHIVDGRATHETSHAVQRALYRTLRWVITSEKENEAKTTRVITKILKHTPPPTEGLEPFDPFIALLMWLAIDRENRWAVETIKDIFFKDPIRFANSLDSAVSQVMNDYVVPKNLKTPEKHEITKRAIAWISEAITVATSAIKELRSTAKKHRTEETEKKLHDIYGVIDQVITRLYFAVAYKSDQSEEPVEKIPHWLRCRFYDEVKPLMEQVIEFAKDRENGLMFAPTAYYFIQLLTSFLRCNPKEVLHLAVGVARSSEPAGFTLDSLAVEDVVELVEIVLADHRHEVRDGEGLDDLLNLLDLFAKKGWPEALRLIWHLDEIFR